LFPSIPIGKWIKFSYASILIPERGWDGKKERKKEEKNIIIIIIIIIVEEIDDLSTLPGTWY
jgi:hypothetical protein